MGYRERLVWGQFFGTLAMFGYYFFAMARSHSRGVAMPSLAGTVFVLAMLEGAYAALVAVLSRREPQDERDRWMEFRAYKVAYIAGLGAAVWWLSMALQGSSTLTTGRLDELPLLTGIVGLELLRTGTLLVLYRREARP